MSAHLNGGRPVTKERFRLEFQHRLREHLARNGSTAEAFNLVWSRTMEDVTLAESQQAEIYWELVQWARSYDLFTSAEHKPALGTVEL